MMGQQTHAALLALGALLMGGFAQGCGPSAPLELPAGFTGTERLSGTFGGSTDVRTWGSECRGFVSSSPDHEVQSGSALPYVRFVVNGGALDTTLVVQLPDGSFRCNDDSDGRNPIVEGPLPAGLTKVWVGGYSSRVEGNYRLGITTVSTTSPADIGPPAANSRASSRRSRRRRP